MSISIRTDSFLLTLGPGHLALNHGHCKDKYEVDALIQVLQIARMMCDIWPMPYAEEQQSHDAE